MKCPHCQQLIGTVNVQAIDAYEGATTWKAGAFKCPSCNTILGVSFDEGYRAQWIVDQIKTVLAQCK